MKLLNGTPPGPTATKKRDPGEQGSKHDRGGDWLPRRLLPATQERDPGEQAIETSRWSILSDTADQGDEERDPGEQGSKHRAEMAMVGCDEVTKSVIQENKDRNIFSHRSIPRL